MVVKEEFGKLFIWFKKCKLYIFKEVEEVFIMKMS